MDGGAAHQGGSGANEMADGVVRQRFFEGSSAPVSFDDGGGVLQHGGVEGGEGGRLNEEEEGRRVGSPEEGGAAGVAALRHNPGKGRGSRCSSTLWTRWWCVRGGVCSGGQSWEQRGKGGVVGSGRRAASRATRRRGVGAWGQRCGRVARHGR
jgi:hypothetical protein